MIVPDFSSPSPAISGDFGLLFSAVGRFLKRRWSGDEISSEGDVNDVDMGTVRDADIGFDGGSLDVAIKRRLI